LRHLIEGRRKTLQREKPRVRATYLRDKFKSPETVRPWFKELSGRALSLASDIREKAERAAADLTRPERPFQFHDVAYGSIQLFTDHGNLAVFIEPRPDDDDAHANLVILKEPPPIQYLSQADAKQPHEIYRQIARLLETCDAADLSPLEALRTP
jgi:hypothetical protein